MGSTTIDYFRFLSGTPTAATDRHPLNFLEKAQINAKSYKEAKQIINRAR